MKAHLKNFAPVFGFLLSMTPATEAPAKPTSNQHKPGNQQNPSAGHQVPKAASTPFCGRHHEQPPWSMKFARLKRRPTHLQATRVVGEIGSTIPLRATLTLDNNKGAPVPEQMVAFWVDGHVVGEALTNRKGEAKVNYKVPNKMGPKKVNALFRGNEKCGLAQDTSSVGTLRATTALRLSHNESANQGSATTLHADLTRTSDGAGVSGREVAIYVNGKQVGSSMTDSSGRLRYVYTPTAGSGKANLKAQFLGDVLYTPTAENSSFKLYPARQTVSIQWAHVTGMYGETVKASAVLYRGNAVWGPKVANIPVTFYRTKRHLRSKKLGTATSNTNGRATISFTIDDKPNTYSLEAHAEIPKHLYDLKEANLYYDGPTLTVLPATVKLIATGPATVQIEEWVTYNVKAIRTTDNQPVAGLTICRNGCVQTDTSGNATVQYHVNSQEGTGPREVSFVSAGDDYHQKSSTKITVTAKPSVN